MKNIDNFNRACALVFSALYDSFPVPAAIDPNSVGFIEKNNSASEPRAIFSATLCFLADEEFIQYDRATDDLHQKQGVRLTAKGLSKLQKIPHGIQPDAKPLIEQLKDASLAIGRQVSSESTSLSVGKILGLVFGGQT